MKKVKCENDTSITIVLEKVDNVLSIDVFKNKKVKSQVYVSMKSLVKMLKELTNDKS